MDADVAEVSVPEQRETSSGFASGKEAKKESYYYWHGHEKERARVGDVAPKQSPMLVKSESFQPEVHSPILPKPITAYSWCNNTKSVSVYVDFSGVEQLPPEHISVVFEAKDVRITIRSVEATVPSALHLRLAKAIDPSRSQFRTKQGQLVLKLDKGGAEDTWYDLTDNKPRTDDE